MELLPIFHMLKEFYNQLTSREECFNIKQKEL